MEFQFDINTVLPQEITILNADYRILNSGQTARILTSDKLTSIIDAIGEASYKAQGLPGPITSSRKLRISDHRLYLMKNATAHNNLGSILGLLKVGTKQLYVHDSHGQVHERTPLCLLDFYVHESKQRSGYGKKLFDAMLEFEKCHAYELAIDRPSNKCLGFLQKHYHLSTPIRQVNNFVVFNGFFNRSPISQSRKSSASRHFGEKNLPVDNFRRPELLSSDNQQYRRTLPERNDGSTNNTRLQTVLNENDSWNNRRHATIIGAPLGNNERKISSAYSQDSLLNDPLRTNANSHSASHISRTYTSLFNENNPFPSLRRYNTNLANPTAQPAVQNYSYKDYQTAPMNNLRQNPDTSSLTSIYTFPSLLKPNTDNWRKPPLPPQQQQQQSPMDASSSAWRVFGVNR